jgi:hypothetical protein
MACLRGHPLVSVLFTLQKYVYELSNSIEQSPPWEANSPSATQEILRLYRI